MRRRGPALQFHPTIFDVRWSSRSLMAHFPTSEWSGTLTPSFSPAKTRRANFA
jgi:hypothetical protein